MHSPATTIVAGSRRMLHRNGTIIRIGCEKTAAKGSEIRKNRRNVAALAEYRTMRTIVSSGEDRLDHGPFDVGEPEVPAVVAECQPLVIEAEQVQHGSM